MAAKHVHNTQAQLLGADEPSDKKTRKRTTPEPSSERNPKRRHRALIITLVILALVAAGVGAWFVVDPPLYFVAVNGQRELVRKNVTIQTLIDEGKVTPTPGNLVAIDGSIATPGGGTPFEAKVDGVAVTDPATTLAKDAVLEIGDGSDIDETFTEGEETVPAGLEEYDTDSSAYYRGALHLYTHGSEGRAMVKRGDVSGVEEVEILEEPIPSTYSIENVPGGAGKVIALTFDDGPWDTTTSQILDVLEKNKAHATFFTIGEQVADHPDVVRRAHNLGCQIATHTWDHAAGSGEGTNLCVMSAEEQVNEVKDGFAAIAEVIGEEPSRVMRAPGGNFYGKAVENLEPYLDAEIGWNIDTRDWEQPGAEAIFQAIMFAQPGNVVLLHDGGGDRSQTVEALKRAVPELIKKGYRLVTIDELLEYL